MSYCVNCGVELDPSLRKCPLCHTPVINPSLLSSYETISPYPTEKGQIEPVHKKDFAILITIMLVTISITCGLLNFLVFRHNLWSLLVIGFCLLLWVLLVPSLFIQKLSAYIKIFIDGATTVLYLYMISYLTKSHHWVTDVGLPIVLLITILAESFWFVRHHLKVSILTTSLYIFLDIAILCAGIELIARIYMHAPILLSWSAVVMTVCIIFMIAIITLLLKPSLRDALRRRMHF